MGKGSSPKGQCSFANLRVPCRDLEAGRERAVRPAMREGDASREVRGHVRALALVRYRVSPRISNRELNRLYGRSWPHHTSFDFSAVLKSSLGWVGGFEGKELVGFVYLAWDGAQHAFLLEPTVLPRLRRQGIGKQLVDRAVDLAGKSGCEWVHVDWEPHLTPFYRACGFLPTRAGLIRLSARKSIKRGR
ncbi:MAG: GNAT family N-acetyltransferase [Thermoplasmata archaeon]